MSIVLAIYIMSMDIARQGKYMAPVTRIMTASDHAQQTFPKEEVIANTDVAICYRENDGPF